MDLIPTESPYFYLEESKSFEIDQTNQNLNDFCVLFTSTKKNIFLVAFLCLSVCLQNNSKFYGQILMKFSGNVVHDKRKR